MTAIAGQTTVEPCAICGEPSESIVQLTPPQYGKRGGEEVLIRNAVDRWLCATHLEAAARDRGWQDKQAEKRREERKQMKAAQAEVTLFDPGEAGGRRSFEDLT